MKDCAIGPIATQLRQLYFDATRGHLSAYRKWLLPVYHAQPGGAKGAMPLEETSVA